MKKLSLAIGGKRYTVTLEDPYAAEVERELFLLFDEHKDNETKVLLQAFLTKQIECLELESRLRELLHKFPDSEPSLP